MGDRVSIQFKDRDGSTRPVLFSHWGGMEFVEEAQRYVTTLTTEVGAEEMLPLHRLEAQTVMVDFIRFITAGMARVKSNLYLGVDEDDGDNSDNGHHVIELRKKESTP